MATAAKIPIMAITIINSINENPLIFELLPLTNIYPLKPSFIGNYSLKILTYFIIN
ncbi:MAG: hypothetical protein JWM09_1154 [Francisellaceae bacterium]|nr:hypothetical protein [Francisellaceae bacterium]